MGTRRSSAVRKVGFSNAEVAAGSSEIDAGAESCYHSATGLSRTEPNWPDERVTKRPKSRGLTSCACVWVLGKTVS